MNQERIEAVYRVRCTAAEIDARARAIATEQSVEMPLAGIVDDWIRDEIVAQLVSIEPDAAAPQAHSAAATGGEAWRVTLSLDARTVDGEPGQLMNMLFGNSSLQPDVELIDTRLPATLLQTLPGPAFGIQGLRAMAQAPRRALTCTALKPQGLPPERLAALAGQFARAGIDFIKDDHGIADQAYAPFAERVPAIQRAVAQANAETGGHSVYLPSLSGGAQRVMQQLRIARDEGVRGLLACPLLLGVSSFVELLRAPGEFVLLAHPALAGSARIAPALLLGRLIRLFGADATIFPNYGGRFSYGRETCLEIADAARGPLGPHRGAIPVPAGGMRVDRVEEMIEAYGADVMLLIGGNLLEAREAMPERARAFVERVRRAGGA